MSLVGSVEILLVSCKDWILIPAENLIAAATGTPTRIVMEVKTPSQVQGAAFALELGVDGLLLQGDSPELWEAAVACRSQRAARAAAAEAERETEGVAPGQQPPAAAGAGIALQRGTVTRVAEGGIGDRVCLDLIRLLERGEGLLVGSSAKLLTLVHAETFATDFVPSRPFRVNGGPVHSYVLMADRTTKYLSEVVAGDTVLVVSGTDGETRPVTVGRSKLERRPMVMVEFAAERAGGEPAVGQVFLQQAETVRLLSPDPSAELGWRPLSVTETEKGDQILIRVVDKGTHVGRAISAKVTER